MKDTEYAVALSQCDWIIKQADELKALIAHNSPEMIALNKTRADSALETMHEAMSYLIEFISWEANR